MQAWNVSIAAVAIAAQCEKWKIFLRYFSPNSLRWLTVSAVFWLFHKGQSNNAMQDVRPSSKIISHNCATSIATNLLLCRPDSLHICKEGSATLSLSLRYCIRQHDGKSQNMKSQFPTRCLARRLKSDIKKNKLICPTRNA